MLSNTTVFVTLLVQMIVMLAVLAWAWQQRSRWQESLRNEIRQNRDDVGDNLLRSQEQLQQQSFQLMRAMNEVNLSLAESERKWTDVKVWGDSVQRLKDIFEAPSARGRILGEATLERLLSDILPPGYYAFQVPVGSNRADAAIVLSHAGVFIPIDSKFPEDSGQILRYAKEIAQKYVRPDLGTSHFAYLYLPTEKLWTEAVSAPKVWQELVALKVLPVSPHTFSLALHSVACCVSYFESSRTAKQLLSELSAKHLALENCGNRLSTALQGLHKTEEAIEKSKSEVEKILGLFTKSKSHTTLQAEFAEETVV